MAQIAPHPLRVSPLRHQAAVGERRRITDAVIARFRLAQQRGYLPPTLDPRCAALGLIAVMDGLIVNWTLDRTLFSLESYGPLIVDAYLAGVRAEVEH